MSRILKRPMFRKGGEVMEGVMTGIKPRENFRDKGMSDDVAQNIQNRINLIDAYAGTSPLSDPLTQFLLTSGPALVAGEAAGGTKLQEIIGGIKPGLDRATKMQQMKDLNRQKIAASVISKMGTGGLQKYVQQAKDAFRFDTTGELAKKYDNNPERYALVLFNQDRFRQGKSSATIAREAEIRDAINISKIDPPGLGRISEDASLIVSKAKKGLPSEMRANIDPIIPYVHPNLRNDLDYKEDGTIVVSESAQDEFTPNNIYYDFSTKQWVQYSNGILKPAMSSQS